LEFAVILMPLCSLKHWFAHTDIYAGLHSSKYNAIKAWSEILDSGFAEKHSCRTVPYGSPGCLVWLEEKQFLILAKKTQRHRNSLRKKTPHNNTAIL